MFHVGLIDDHGHFLVKPEDRTPEQKDSYSYFDLLVLNLKKMLAKLPGGSSRIATFAAALYLLREGKLVTSNSKVEQLTEQFKFNDYLVEARTLLEDGEGGGGPVPANNIGDGKIADKKQGLGYGKNGKNLLKRKVQPDGSMQTGDYR